MNNGRKFHPPEEFSSLLLEQVLAIHPRLSGEPAHAGYKFLSPDHERVYRPWMEGMLGPLTKVSTHITIRDGSWPASADGQWCDGFPHKHDWTRSVTMVHFLQEPEGGGEFGYIEDGVIHRTKPERGLVVCCDGMTEHGIMAIQGTRKRIVLLTTGWTHDSEWRDPQTNFCL